MSVFYGSRKLIMNHRGQIVQRLRNNSAGTANAGAPVIYDTGTTDAFTTTTSQNDPLIAGVLLQTLPDQAVGEVLIFGFTDLLKVDGTTDIAAGDYITTFTTAGIGAKRGASTSAGQFAIALEAYTTNDANGVIDAWVFPANRVAGATSSWGDDALLNLGTGNDIALVHRALALAADTTLAGVVEGTADTLATAADSLIIGDVTDDGDVHIVVSKAGNTHTAFLADGSTGDTILNAATGQSVDLYVAGAKEYDFSATAIDLAANHLDNAGYLIMNAVTLPASTEVYIGHDNTGDATVNALTGKTVNMAVAGTDVATFGGTAITFSQALTINSDLTVTGSLTFGGNWTVGATLTVDELILDTDGAQPAGTNCALFRDNAGDLTAQAISGKQVIVAIVNTDEYTFSATIADFLGNAIDNAGYLILNAATAPAATEVYAVNDNTGDLTLNALDTKAVNVAINGTDEVAFSGTAHVINEASNDRDFRVETAALAYALYLDGGKDSLVLGANTDVSSAYKLVSVDRPARTGAATTNYADLWVEPTGAYTVAAGTTAIVTSAYLAEPNITLGGQTVTLGATLYIASQPTEGGTNAGINLADGVDLAFGSTTDARIRWSEADVSTPALVIAADSTSRAIHICEGADIATDWAVANESHPSLYIHSATTPSTDYVKILHDSDNCFIDVYGGSFYMRGAGANWLSLGGSALTLQNAQTLQGGIASAGDLTLMSTSHATKGFITVAATEPGVVVGGTGASVDRATNDGTNAIHLFNGTAPVGAMTNGVTLYSSGGEFYAMDAAGNAVLNSPHSDDGDFIYHSYNAKQDKTVRVHLEKLLRRLAQDPRYTDLIEERPGMAHNHEW